MENSAALGNSSGVTLSGGSLQLQGDIATTNAILLTLNGPDVASGAPNNLSGSNTYSGNIIANVASTIGSTAGTLTLTGGINNGGHLLTFTGAGNTTVSHAITGGGGLTYSGSGSGILNLAVANSYGGTTTVSSGALQISNGMTGSATSTGSVMVSGGTLGGAGTISGPVTVATGGAVAPGIGQAPAGVTSYFGSTLTLNSGATLDFNLSSVDDSMFNTANDHIMVSGALSLSGGTINVNDYDGSLEAGNYELIGYGGSTPSTTGWSFGSVPGYTFGVTAGDNQFDLVVTVASGSATWSSNSNGDYGTAGNWQPGTYPNGPGQIATFGLGTQANVSVSASYTVGELLFNNSTTGYDLTGGNLTLDNSGSGALVSVATSTQMPTILTSLTLADSSHSTTFNVASGSSLDITGTVGESSMVTESKSRPHRRRHFVHGSQQHLLRRHHHPKRHADIARRRRPRHRQPDVQSAVGRRHGHSQRERKYRAQQSLGNARQRRLGQVECRLLDDADVDPNRLGQFRGQRFARFGRRAGGGAKQRQHADPRRQADVGQRQFGDGQLRHALLGQQHRGQHYRQPDSDGGVGRDVAIGRFGGGPIEFGEHHHDGHRRLERRRSDARRHDDSDGGRHQRDFAERSGDHVVCRQHDRGRRHERGQPDGHADPAKHVDDRGGIDGDACAVGAAVDGCCGQRAGKRAGG